MDMQVPNWTCEPHEDEQKKRCAALPSLETMECLEEESVVAQPAMRIKGDPEERLETDLKTYKMCKYFHVQALNGGSINV